VAGDTTLRTPADRPSGVAARVPWLTILWHPRLERIGEGCAVGDRLRVSRLEPELGPPGGPGEPLGEPHVSRTPISIEMQPDGGARIAGADLLVRGMPGAAVVTAAQIDAGVVLELAGWVALLLHRRRPPVKQRPSAIVGGGEAIDDLRAAIARLAAITDPVLVAGETGAGKERVSRALHDESSRAKGPFVAVNMATLAPGTAAAQLFGHVKGAFTGADRAVAGLFAQADGGTLLLDEIFDAPADVQPMLLRALDAGEILPLGADAPRTIDVRVIAATDADLDAAQARGAFRPQLFHRLAVHRVVVPPLRARIDDVGRLLASFIRRELGELPAGSTPWLPTAAVRACATYTWPGNVRELDAAARRLALVGRTGSITLADALTALDLEGADDAGAPVPDAAPPLSTDFDDARLVATLAAHRWQPTATARALGVSKTTLYARMDACPQIRKARDLERAEIEATGQVTAGDLDAMSALLRVSRRGLQLRMRELGLP